MRHDHPFMAAPKKTLVIVAFVALYLIWGSTYLGIRFAIETIPPFLMAGARFVLAGIIMYAIAWSQGIGKSTWANWGTSLIIGACLLLGGNGGVTISEQFIDSGTGGVSGGDRSHLHCVAWMDDRNGAATDAGDVDGACRRFCWRGSFIRTGSAFSFRRWPKSCNWNIDPARHKFHLVGWFALFASCKTCALAVSDCRSTNDLRRNFAFDCRLRHR